MPSCRSAPPRSSLLPTRAIGRSPETLLHAFAHALPARWYRMAAMLNGAACLRWVAGIVGAPDIATLLERTEAEYRGPSRILFLPYLSGERTPHNDPDARGVFVGLDPDAGATDLAQAVLEGVAFSLVEARDLLEGTGMRLPAVAAVGGGAKSRFWMQLLAHALGIAGRALCRQRDGAGFRRRAPRPPGARFGGRRRCLRQAIRPRCA